MFTQNPVITFHYDFAYSLHLVIPYQKKIIIKNKQIVKKEKNTILNLKENSFNEKPDSVTNLFYSKSIIVLLSIKNNSYRFEKK